MNQAMRKVRERLRVASAEAGMTHRSIVAGLLLALPLASLAAQDSTRARARICLAPSSVEAAAGSADAALNAVRETFTSFLTGPSLEVAPLGARLESQVRQEARAAGCAYLLLTKVKHVRKSGGGLLGRMAGGAAQQGAWSVGAATGSAVGRVVAGAAAGAAGVAAANYASWVKVKDELTLTSRLESADGTVLVNRKDRRKARSDGEDLLTPLVEQAAGKIADAVAKHASRAP